MLKPGVSTILIIALFLFSCSNRDVLPPDPVMPVPTERQLKWLDLEQYAFIHFTMNTFTDKEWGYGDEDPLLFNPTDFDPDQWCSTLKDVGFKGLVLTTKHHDGFCLWPSAYTDHTIKSSPYKDGKGDMVMEVARACRKYGLKFGIYLSPWDRNHKDYGSDLYIEYYRNQLRELFSTYGPVFEMWFDGANGGDGYYGGTREARKIDGKNYYDWPNTIALIREMEPEIIFFSDAGPDVRWCGNEEGYVSSTNWNNLFIDTIYAGKPGINELLNSGSEDGNYFIPAEVDVSIRPGWFYHASEDSLVKTPEQLFEIYLNSIGRGANLILNIPPDRRGLLHENDIRSLKGWKDLIDAAFHENIIDRAKIEVDTYRGRSRIYSAESLTDKSDETYWATDDAVRQGKIEIIFPHDEIVSYVVLREYLRLGQRIKSFSIEVFVNNQWQTVANETTVGHKRIIRLDPVETSRIRINILDSKAAVLLSELEIY